jgi:hypothetical protein
MSYQGLFDRKGEAFAYLSGNRLYTLDDEYTGRLEDDYIVDVAGNRIWRVYDDGVYSLDSMRPIGYFGEIRSDEF